MRALSFPPLQPLAGVAPIVLRVVVGVVMFAHGLQKFQDGPAGFGEGMIGEMIGLPAPVFLGWVVTLTELVVGAALVLGAATRLAAVGVAIIMLGATFLVKLEGGLIAEGGAGYELDLALLAGAVGVLLLGPGRPSVDHLIGVEATEPKATPVGSRA